MSLFRHQALQPALPFGRTLLSTPRFFGWPLWCLLLLLVCVGVWLAEQNYTHRLTVAGYAEPGSPVTRVFPPAVGIVTTIFVSEGDWVEVGERLVALELGARTSANRTHVAAIRERVHRLITENIEQQRIERHIGEKQRSTLLRTRAQLQQMAGVFVDEQDLAHARVALLNTQSQRFATLASKGHVSRFDVDRQHQALMSAQQSLAAVRRQVMENQAAIERTGADAALLLEQHKLKDSELRMRKERLRAELEDLASRERAMVVAPVAGRVGLLQASIGRRHDPQQALVSLASQVDDHRVVLLLPSNVMGEVSRGDTVRLRYAGYPYQRYGTRRGRIERIASTPQLPAEASGIVRVVQPVYPAWVEVLDRDHPWVVPGMQVQADIVTRVQPLWRWVVDPLAAFWQRT